MDKLLNDRGLARSKLVQSGKNIEITETTVDQN